MRPLCQRMQATGKDIPASTALDPNMRKSIAKPDIPTPVIVLPGQANAANENSKSPALPAERKSIQSYKTPKSNQTATVKSQANNASKRTNEGARLSPRSQRKRGDGQPARDRTPVDQSRPNRKGNIVLFMPYLHYETHRNRKSMSETIRRARTGSASASAENHMSQDCDEMLIHAYLRSTPNLHIRRTLDQFYYHAISTDDRDTDQVVYRYTRDKRQGRKVFMVDQLWMWIIGKDLIITSFPQRWKQPKSDPLNVLDGIIRDMNSKTCPPVNSVHDLATLVTGRCCGVFDRHQLGDEKFQFLDMFESSIGKIVSLCLDRWVMQGLQSVLMRL